MLRNTTHSLKIHQEEFVTPWTSNVRVISKEKKSIKSMLTS